MTAIIQSLWIGDRLSSIEQLALASFVAHGHEFHLYTYNPLEDLPDGVTTRNANEIIPQSAIFRTRNGSVALFADWFRWKLLFERGGYWVDTDMVCLKAFDFSDELVFGREGHQRINNAVLSMPPGHKLAQMMLDAATSPLKAQVFDDEKILRKKRRGRRWLRNGYEVVPWSYIAGPGAFTNALEYLDLTRLAKPHIVFYPVNCDNWDAIFDNTYAGGMGPFQESYGIHLWNEMMRRKAGFDKSGRFPESSLIERLKSTYLKNI